MERFFWGEGGIVGSGAEGKARGSHSSLIAGLTVEQLFLYESQSLRL